MRKWIIIGAVALISATAGLVGGAAASGDAAPPSLPVVPLDAPTFQPDNEMLYVPVAPCRVLDSRIHGGALANGAIRTYYIGGTSGFAPQGGKSGGCGVPVGATSITGNLATINASGPGFLTAYPAGQSRPTAASFNHLGGTSSTGVTLPINSTTAQSLNIYNASSSTQLALDVSGYFVPQLAGMISPSGTPYSGTRRIVSGSRASAGVYDVVFDRNIRYCSAVASVYVTGYYASTSTFFDSTHPNTVRVFLYNADGAPADQYFYIHVNC